MSVEASLILIIKEVRGKNKNDSYVDSLKPKYMLIANASSYKCSYVSDKSLYAHYVIMIFQMRQKHDLVMRTTDDVKVLKQITHF